IHGGGDQVRAGDVLELTDTAAQVAARTAGRALEAGNLRRDAIRPAEAESWADVHAAWDVVVPSAKDRIDDRVELRAALEVCDVGPETISDLEARRPTIGVAERGGEAEVIALTPTRLKAAGEARRNAGLEVRKRIVSEVAEAVRR